MLATDIVGRFSVFGIGRLSSFCIEPAGEKLSEQ